MLSMNELMDIRMQQHIAQEIYRQQIMQRIPDPFSSMLSMHMPPHHLIAPPRPTLPGVDVKLENDDLWQQFHKIGTEMIITKTGRRMFPSQRISLTGLEEESSYCVLLEMVPIGNCRYKFSGSQWVPAGGVEPQSPQRMYLHPDSPSTGAHWQSQPILFNKVKLTNNTMDHSGQIVLASMHKYQPRIHVVRTSDLSQIPWAPQQDFIFPETEFIAVTAYQNDRITKLKIDNNPFAKGFRETGQSRCKRKISSSDETRRSTDSAAATTVATLGPSRSSNTHIEDDRSSVSSYDAPQSKRFRPYDCLDDASSVCSSRGSKSPHFDEVTLCSPAWMQAHSLHQSDLISMPLEVRAPYFLPTPAMHPIYLNPFNAVFPTDPCQRSVQPESECLPLTATTTTTTAATTPENTKISENFPPKSPKRSTTKRNSFSISAILAY